MASVNMASPVEDLHIDDTIVPLVDGEEEMRADAPPLQHEGPIPVDFNPVDTQIEFDPVRNSFSIKWGDKTLEVPAVQSSCRRSPSDDYNGGIASPTTRWTCLSTIGFGCLVILVGLVLGFLMSTAVTINRHRHVADSATYTTSDNSEYRDAVTQCIYMSVSNAANESACVMWNLQGHLITNVTRLSICDIQQQPSGVPPFITNEDIELYKGSDNHPFVHSKYEFKRVSIELLPADADAPPCYRVTLGSVAKHGMNGGIINCLVNLSVTLYDQLVYEQKWVEDFMVNVIDTQPSARSILLRCKQRDLIVTSFWIKMHVNGDGTRSYHAKHGYGGMDMTRDMYDRLDSLRNDNITVTRHFNDEIFVFTITRGQTLSTYDEYMLHATIPPAWCGSASDMIE